MTIENQLMLLTKERELLMTQTENIAESALQKIDTRIIKATEKVEVFYRLGYSSIVLAIIIGVVIFFIILFRI